MIEPLAIILFSSAFAEDALNAHNMNVRPGGKQPCMRPGWYRRGGVRWRQSMVFESGPLKGQPKGLREVCRERFGEDRVKGIMIEAFKIKARLSWAKLKFSLV